MGDAASIDDDRKDSVETPIITTTVAGSGRRSQQSRPFIALYSDAAYFKDLIQESHGDGGPDISRIKKKTRKTKTTRMLSRIQTRIS